MHTKKTFTGFIVLLIVLSTAYTAFGQNLRQGFLGTQWRSNISDLKGFTQISERGLVSYYRNPGAVFTLDEIRIPDVIYGFYENRFFAVYIRIESPDAFGRIKDYMIAQYGSPKESFTMKNEQTVYGWTYQTVKMKLKLYEKIGNMKLAFYYLPLSQKVNIAQEEIRIENTPKLFPIERDQTPEYIPILRF